VSLSLCGRMRSRVRWPTADGRGRRTVRHFLPRRSRSARRGCVLGCTQMMLSQSQNFSVSSVISVVKVFSAPQHLCGRNVFFVIFGKRQASLVVLVNWNVLIMTNGRESCSRPLSEWERSCPLRLGKANARAVASRELESASLHEIGSGQPAEDGEASMGREGSTRCTGPTPRGERRQRARKEPSGTWETRSGVQRQPPRGSHNPGRGRIAVSDGLIVVRIRR